MKNHKTVDCLPERKLSWFGTARMRVGFTVFRERDIKKMCGVVLSEYPSLREKKLAGYFK
jgi:hypothetical protein